MPESTQSGRRSSTSQTPSSTRSTGVPSQAWRSGPISCRRRMLCRLRAEEMAERLRSGATVTTRPKRDATRARAARPGAQRPSSLVSRIRRSGMAPVYLPRPGSILGQEAEDGGQVRAHAAHLLLEGFRLGDETVVLLRMRGQVRVAHPGEDGLLVVEMLGHVGDEQLHPALRLCGLA